MSAYGIDGCKKGWFFVALGDDEAPRFGIVPQIRDLVQSAPGGSTLLIDIPIGLREGAEGPRLCDPEARRILGAKRSSVFPPPCRQAAYAEDYESASAINHEITNKKISIQTWSIIPKIREVDQFLRNEMPPGIRIRECHPELCFHGFKGGPLRPVKKNTEEGYQERLDLLASQLPEAPDIVHEALLKYQAVGGVARDDILDALAAAVCALHIEDCQTLPQEPEIDNKGLSMEMVWLPLR